MFFHLNDEGEDGNVQPMTPADVTPDRTAPDFPSGTLSKGYSENESGMQMREPKDD